MDQTYKKWLFFITFFLVIQQPKLQAMHRKLARSLSVGVRYLVNTVKSDLSIGDNIVQHHSCTSQLAAACRLVQYNLLINIGIILVRNKMEMLKFSMNSGISAQFEQSQITGFELLACTVVPCIEELLFTYLPEKFNIPPIMSAVVFGLCHCSNDDSYLDFHVVSSASGNYIRRRYLLGRKDGNGSLNLTPIYAHIFNNILASLLTRL